MVLRGAGHSFTEPGFWEQFVSFSPGKNNKAQSSLNTLQSRARTSTKSDFLGLALIRRVPK